MAVRYEDMVFQPKAIAKRMRTFTDIGPDQTMKEWIQTLERGKNNIYDPYLPNRKYPRLTATDWKNKLSFSNIERIQSCCAKYMQHFGYEFMTEVDLEDKGKLGFKVMPDLN